MIKSRLIEQLAQQATVVGYIIITLIEWSCFALLIKYHFVHMILGIYNKWKLEHDAEELQEMQGIVSIITSVLYAMYIHL